MCAENLRATARNKTRVCSLWVRLSPDRYALFRVLQPLDAAQVVWQAVRRVTSHDGDHNLGLQQGGLELDLLLHRRHQLRHPAGHQSAQQRPQHTGSRSPGSSHRRFQNPPRVQRVRQRERSEPRISHAATGREGGREEGRCGWV